MALRDTYLKKSSLQYTWSPLEKHLSVSCAWQSAHCKHRECQHRSRTFSINLSNIGSPHPAHFGMAAESRKIHNYYVMLKHKVLFNLLNVRELQCMGMLNLLNGKISILLVRYGYSTVINVI